MLRQTVLLVAAFAVTMVSADPRQIFLPSDVDDVTVHGNGFTININQKHKNLQNQWKEVEKEADGVIEPRKKSNDDDQPIINNNLYENTKQAKGSQSYGLVENDLLDWLENRATSLAERVERYEGEAFEESLTDANKVVVEVLLLNTLTDLSNLVKEGIKDLKWLKNKLRRVGKFREPMTQFIDEFVRNKIDANLAIEKKKKGTNKPGDDWQRNTQALKRILNEQRYSDYVSKAIVTYLSGYFNMMERSRVYQDINKSSKRLDDGLFYKPAKGHVPPHFPFYSQDAIANGL